MNYREFVTSLRSGTPLSVYVFCGTEAFLRKDALARLKSRILPAGLEDLNCSELVNPSVSQITDNADTLPLMSDRRLVIVRELALLGQEGKAKSKDDGKETPGDRDSERLLSYLQAVPETVTIVFDAGSSLDRRKKLGKTLAALPGFVSFDPLEDRDLAGFLTKRAQSNGVKIRQDAIDRLIFLSGRDLHTLNAEIDKLSAYAAARGSIEAADVDAVATRTAEARVFDMIDALLDGRTGVAFAQLNILLEAGEARLGIMALITRQVRQMLYIKDMTGAGKGQQEIASTLGIKPFIVGKIAGRVRGIPTEELTRRLSDCIRAEYDVKCGALREDAALDTLFLRLRGIGR